MPRYAHVSVSSSDQEFPYIVIDENHSVIGRCKDRETAHSLRSEYDAHRNHPEARTTNS